MDNNNQQQLWTNRNLNHNTTKTVTLTILLPHYIMVKYHITIWQEPATTTNNYLQPPTTTKNGQQQPTTTIN